MTHDVLHKLQHLHHHIPRTILPSVTSTTGDPTNSTTEPAAPSSTIAEYTYALNGVNTPMDLLLQKTLWWSLGSLALLMLLIRIAEMAKTHLRHLTAMSATRQQQAYWATNQSSWYPTLQKHLLYAPLFRKRHNREIRLSAAINMGTIPSRFHTIILALYVFSNFTYCALLNYKLLNIYQILAELRGRTGVLAVVNMVPLVLLAGRNNPLISLLGVSFDTYNLLHRWMGRIVVIESVVHTLAWAINQYAAGGWDGIAVKMGDNTFIQYGTVATAAVVLLSLSSPSAVRHAFYETFLNVHIILAAAAMAGVWVHCDVGSLPQLPYIKGVVGLWVGDRLARVARVIYCNYSCRAFSKATVEILPGEACRVTVHLPKHIDVPAGTHAYLRFASIKPWESHPFSIAWIEETPLTPTDASPSSAELEKLELDLRRAPSRTSVSFIVHAQSGLTRTLYNRALAHSQTSSSPYPFSTRAALEGPYATEKSLASYGSVLLFAGSSGITHHLPTIRHLLLEIPRGTVATRHVTLIWIVRDMAHLEWVRPWMDIILLLPGRREHLTIKLFVTRPGRAGEVRSPSSTVQMWPGRPNVDMLVKEEVQRRIGAMWVGVCGPGGLSDSVRGAVRDVMGGAGGPSIDFGEESFTW